MKRRTGALHLTSNRVNERSSARLWPVVTGVAIALTLVACKSPTPPKGVQPITGFDASRYLGKWYEVARLENRFERGLEQVTATYGKRSDGGISVLNRGYDPVKKNGMRAKERRTLPANRPRLR